MLSSSGRSRRSHTPRHSSGKRVSGQTREKKQNKTRGWKTKKMMVHKIEAGKTGGGGINEEENATKKFFGSKITAV